MVLVDGSGAGSSAAAARFDRIAEAVAGVQTRPEVSLDRVPAPTRLASFGVALSADVLDDEDEIASGRLVLLHEPGGHEAWDGDYRAVAFVRASVEADLGADPLLTAVGWSWLEEALAAAGVEAIAVGGTVTAVTNESFGTMTDQSGGCEIEIRASWTPVLRETSDLERDAQAHVDAWLDLMCTAAGLTPLPDGVVALPRQRGRR